MKMDHVEGKKVADIQLFGLSTCQWCQKTKKMLDKFGVAYDYVFVDMLDDDEKAKVEEVVKKWNPDCSFPTMVLNNKSCIVGFQPDEIKEKLGL